MKRFFNRALRILLVANWLISIASAMLGPIYALFVKQIGGNILDSCYASALFFATAGITTLFSGKYSDKLKDNELIIVLGYSIVGIGFLGYTVVTSVFSLLVIQVITGLGEAIYVPVFDAVYSKHLDRNQSGLQWGTYEALSYFTWAIGALIGGVLVTLFGFNTMFIVMALLCFSGALYIATLPRNTL